MDVNQAAISPRKRMALAVASVVSTTLICAGLLAAAALVPAPPGILPLVILTCLACPMSATYELSRAMAAVREPRLQLRRELERLPEVPHPLGY